jgi:surface polysaccharide O-acyltransferase-like enzyme
MHWIDNLRVLVIILVVILHAGVTYSGLGGWYYKENTEVDLVSTFLFAFYLTFNQAYFMSLLFMVSGYFSAASLEKKGTAKFVAGRFKRLGIPLLIFIFLLHPLSVKLAYPDVNLLEWYLNGIRNFYFVSWTGPLWFVEALLIFSLLYVFVFRPLLRKVPVIRMKPSTINITLLIALITLIAFSVRLYYPIGTDVANLQFSFFTAYVFMFAVGVMAYKARIFDHITYRDGKKWFFISLGLGIPAWVLIMIFAGPSEGVMIFEGGMNWPAFFYALWESFFCVTFIIALVGIFKHRYNKGGRFQKFLSDNAFGVFVFHAPVLIAISMVLRTVTLHPLLKFLIVSILAVSASFGVAWLVRRVGVLKKVFS